jgi:hypothetical protein
MIDVHGRDVEVRLIQSTKPKNSSYTTYKKGDRWKDTYQAHNLSLRIDYLVVKTCRKGQKACDFIDTDAVLTIEYGKDSQTQKLTGGFACIRQIPGKTWPNVDRVYGVQDD